MKEREFSILMSKAKEQVKDILQERGKDYGSFSDVSSFVNEFYITNIKSVVDRITELNNDEYNRAMVALFMIGIKLARLENDVENPHFDSVIDFLGYLELLKETGIKGLELKNNLKCSTLHKRLIEYANNELKESNEMSNFDLFELSCNIESAICLGFEAITCQNKETMENMVRIEMLKDIETTLREKLEKLKTQKNSQKIEKELEMKTC